MGDVSVNLVSSGSNIINLSGSSDTAVLITNQGIGNSLINITGNWNISNYSGSAAGNKDGVEANATYGIAQIIHNGTGTINTNAGHGVLVNGNTGAIADIAAGVTITVNNAISGSFNFGNHGIMANSDAGAAWVTNKANIITSGSLTDGIHAEANRGVTVNHDAVISVTADNSNGIFAYSKSSGNNAVNVEAHGKISITSPGAGGSSMGIRAQTNGTGAVTVTGDAEIDLSMATGDFNHGIYANSWAGGSAVIYAGDITTGTGEDSSGIRALSDGGDAIIIYEGDILTNGDNSDGLYAYSNGTTGSSYVIVNSGTITTRSNSGTGADAHGIVAVTDSGNIGVDFSGTKIETNGNNGYGIFTDATNYSSSSGIGTTTIQNTGLLFAYGTNSGGIYSRSGSGSVDIVNTGSIRSYNDGGAAINVLAASADITVQNSGTIETGNNMAGTGANNIGIRLATAGSGIIDLQNTGNITTIGNGASGIFSRAGNGNTSIRNAGDITTGDSVAGTGASAHGIHANSIAGSSGDILIENTGTIITNGLSSAIGILGSAAGSGDVMIRSLGADITTTGTGSGNHGIEARSDNGGSAVISYIGGTVTVNGTAYGLVAWNGNSGILNQNSAIYVENGIIDASAVNGAGAVAAFGSDDALISLDANTKTHGGWGNSVAAVLGGTRQTLLNNGVIDALNDQAVRGDVNASGSLLLVNNNTITGMVNAASSVVNFDNNGLWQIRNFADTDGDGIREHFSVAVNDLGTSGSNTITNNGVIEVLGHNHEALTLDTTGMYLPLGNANNAMSLSSPTQAQILGATTFINNGVIDLTANASIGDVLVITGGQTPGSFGGGTFVTGGQVKMNTALNEGGPFSHSDVLVLDSTQLSANATVLSLETAGKGALTIGDGILLVEVLGSSAHYAFTLDKGRIASNLYQYELFHGGNPQTGGNTHDGNWYLRSDYRDEAMIYSSMAKNLVNMSADMIGSFDIRRRLPHYNRAQEGAGFTYTDQETWCRDPQDPYNEKLKYLCTVKVAEQIGPETTFSGSWGRVIGEHGEQKSFKFPQKSPRQEYDMYGIQVGSDIWGHMTEEGTVDVIGAYFGAVRKDADILGNSCDTHCRETRSNIGSTKSDAYSFGVYWSHLSASGWYTDAVLQATHYDVEASSVWGENVDPKGWGGAASLEAGYSFNLGNGFSATPQGQVIYQRISLDGFSDSFSHITIDDVNNLRGRIGVQLEYDFSSQGKPVSVWGKANIWHDFTSDNKLTFSDLNMGWADTVKTPMDGTWLEVGVGISGNLSDNLALVAEGSYNYGLDNHDETSWGGKVGLKFTW